MFPHTDNECLNLLNLNINWSVSMTNYILEPENDLVIFGGGHAASVVLRAAKKGLVKPKAVAAVAPTWAGPLPIVFGRDSSMETR